MPRLPINYANTVIYKIVCNDLSITECYVGHTTEFSLRKTSHKKRCRNESDKKHNLRVYQIIRDTGGWENYSMIEIEKYPCQDSKEACAKEREWYEKLNSGLNTNCPQRTHQEWYVANRDTILENHKQYHKDNTERIKEHHSEYYLKNRTKLLKNQNQYRDDNREKILLKKKEYRDSHREYIREKAKETFLCECGKETTHAHKLRHFLSKFHTQFIKDSPQPSP